MGVKFYLHFALNELYISLPAEKIVVKLDPRKHPLKPVPVAGNGQACKGNSACGDNANALKAQLTYPKVNISVYTIYAWPLIYIRV